MQNKLPLWKIPYITEKGGYSGEFFVFVQRTLWRRGTSKALVYLYYESEKTCVENQFSLDK